MLPLQQFQIPIKTLRDLENETDLNNTPTRLRVNYARCYCRLFEFLSKRCKSHDNVIFGCEINKFWLRKKEKNEGFEFLRNSVTNTFLAAKFFQFEITNEHLLGLYNPYLLFDVAARLKKIRDKFSLNLTVQKNELIILDNLQQAPKAFGLFKKLVETLDELSKTLSFTIQVAPNKFFVINRILKLSCGVMEEVLNKNCLKEIINFSFIYFECFSITPMCCRMQSVAPTKVFDFEKFSFYHISEKYFSEYIKFAKFLYPFISDISANMLRKSYLQIIPTTLVNLKKPLKLLEVFKNLEYHGINVISLASGNFCLSNYLDVSAEMLLNIINPEMLKNSFDQLTFLKQKYGIQLVQLENLIIYDPVEYFEYDHVEYGELLPDGSSYNKKHDIDNKPICMSGCRNIVKSIDTLIVNTSFTYPTLISKNPDAFLRLIHICESIQKCFAPEVSRLHSNADVRSFINDSFSNNFENRIHENCYFFGNSDSGNDAKIKIVVNMLKSLEEKDGVCLSVIEKKIETVEHFNINLLELQQINDVTSLDYFQCSKNDFNAFFNCIQNMNLNGLSFTITNYQTIIFNNYCEIRPATFLKFKNKDRFLSAVNFFCDTMKPRQGYSKNESSEFLLKFFPNCDDFLISAASANTAEFQALSNFNNFTHTPYTIKETNIQIAKELNPLLKNLDRKHFDLPHFQCVPQQFYAGEKADEFLNALKTVRDRRFRLVYFKSYETNIPYIRIDDFAFRFNYFTVLLKPSCLKEFNQFIEDLSVNLKDHLVVKDAYVREICDYKVFASNFIGIPFNSKICNGYENEIYLKKCLNILEKKMVKFRVIENCSLVLNSSVFIESTIFLKLCQANELYLFEALKFFKHLTTDVFTLPDHWLNITTEMTENPFKKAGGFSIVDNKTSDYLMLAKAISPSLQKFSDNDLLSYKYLELLPKNLLLEKEDVNNLLKIFEALKKTKYTLQAAENGNVNLGCIQLPTHMWLKVIAPQSLVKVNNLISEINSKVDHENQIVLHSSGLLSNIEESEDRFPQSRDVVQYKNDLCKYLNCFNKKIKKSNISLSLTLNSNGDIKFGKHIWVPIHMIRHMENLNKLEKIIDIAQIFDNAFIDAETKVSYLENNFMKGVNNLQKQQNAKSLALLLNFILSEELFEFMESGILLVFPAKLYDEWEADPDTTFLKYSTVLKNMQTKGISYYFQFNGNVNIEKTITIKPKQLLQIKDFKELQLLLKMSADLHCKNEVKNFLNKDERVFKTKIDSYEKMVEARNVADKVAKKRNHVEQNGTLFYQKCIWVRANDFLSNKSGNTYVIDEIYQKIEKIFDKSKKIQFQYGRPQLPILTSLLLNSDQKLFEYCYMFCAYVYERDKNIKIEYFVERNQFKFNEAIFIHPRSFFHLRDIDAFVVALQKYSSNIILDPIQREHQFIQDYITLDQLQDIQRNERFEFDYMRKYCLKKLEQIFLQKLPCITAFLPDLNDVNQSPELFFIENISINGKQVFKDGVTGALMENKKVNGVNNYQLKYDQNIFIVSLKIAQDLSEVAENLFDMTSIIECVSEYCKGKRVDNGQMYQANENRITDTSTLMPVLQQHGISTTREYTEMLNFFEAQLNIIKDEQQKSRGNNSVTLIQSKYIFTNALKGLHHWIKHGEYFDSLEHYYNLMNDFFPRQKEYNLEFDYGMVLSRQYTEDLGNKMSYFGSLIIDPDTDKNLCVATFYYEEKKPYTAWEKNVPCTKYLVFTDKPFRKEEKFTMKKEILINLLKKQQPNFQHFISEINTNLNNFKEVDDVTNMLIIITAPVTNVSAKILGKINELQQKFKNAQITLCCNVDLNPHSTSLPTFNLINLLFADVNWCNFHYNKFIENILYRP